MKTLHDMLVEAEEEGIAFALEHGFKPGESGFWPTMAGYYLARLAMIRYEVEALLITTPQPVSINFAAQLWKTLTTALLTITRRTIEPETRNQNHRRETMKPEVVKNIEPPALLGRPIELTPALVHLRRELEEQSRRREERKAGNVFPKGRWS